MNLPDTQIVKVEENPNHGLAPDAFDKLCRELGYSGSVVWNIVKFLFCYGWLQPKHGQYRATLEEVYNAIASYKARFGRFSNILQAMQHARCGFPDFQALSEDQGNPWLRSGVKVIRWTIAKGLPGWDRDRQLELTRKAIQAWQDVCGLQTEYVPLSPSGTLDPNYAPHVSIGLCSRNNGSDGRGGMLAYTYLPTYRPLPIPLLFDVSETFVSAVPKHGDILYLNTCSHELGHVLCGLDHSPADDGQKALMDPYYDPETWKPQAFDIKRALKMWPKPAPTPVPPSLPVPTEPEPGLISIGLKMPCTIGQNVDATKLFIVTTELPTIPGYSIVKKV